METLRGAVGSVRNGAVADAVAALDERGRLERIHVSEALAGRRRFRATSDAGRDYGVVLDANVEELDGLVLLLEEDRAVVVVQEEPATLRLRGATPAGALQLGWHAGHLHWRVRFDGAEVEVLLDAPAEDYLDRILALVDDGAVEVVGHDA